MTNYRGSILEVFDDRVAIGDGCWEWLGAKQPSGYGKMYWDYKTLLAHRVVYELVRGPIPEGLQLDHLCRNPSCVNPSHLEAVTARENVLRSDSTAGRNGRKTHCKRGHEFTPANTYIRPRGRECRACWKTRKLRVRK